MIPRSTILLLMMPTLLLSDVPLTRVESGKLDGINLPSSRRVAARFIGTPLRRQIRMIDKNTAMNDAEPPIRLRSPIKPMRNIFYYGDNQQLSRASGRFHNKAHAFPTHSIPSPQQDEVLLPAPPSYDPKRHHRAKLNADDMIMSEAADMARGLERTTMRVRTFADIDIKKTTTPLPAVTVTKISKKEHQPVSSIDRVASSPSSSALGPPAPPLRTFAREQQRLLLQQQQQAPPLLLAAPQQLQPIRVLPTVSPSSLYPQIGPLIRHPAPFAPPLLHNPQLPPPQAQFLATLPPPPPQGLAPPLPGAPLLPPQQPLQQQQQLLQPPPLGASGLPPGVPNPTVLTQPPLVNSQAPNASLEQLGCGWDWVSNSCKEVFTIGWCGQCHDFGNIFVHNCKCVQPLINVKALVPPGRAA